MANADDTAVPVALVTGAARGIGAATALRLARSGWRLILVDRCSDLDGVPYPLGTRAELERCAAACGVEVARTVVADVRDQDALEGAVRVAVDEHGGLDAVVAAAGVIIGSDDAATTDEAAWRLTMEVNLEGVWRTIRAALPALLARPEPRQGRIVALASAAGMIGIPRLAAYCASKHGVVGLVRSMAAELATEGISVNAVAPGSTATTMLEASAAIYGLDDTAELARQHFHGRTIDPDDIAAVVAWLCRPEARAIMGAVVPADAGMTAR